MCGEIEWIIRQEHRGGVFGKGTQEEEGKKERVSATLSERHQWAQRRDSTRLDRARTIYTGMAAEAS